MPYPKKKPLVKQKETINLDAKGGDFCTPLGIELTFMPQPVSLEGVVPVPSPALPTPTRTSPGRSRSRDDDDDDRDDDGEDDNRDDDRDDEDEDDDNRDDEDTDSPKTPMVRFKNVQGVLAEGYASLLGARLKELGVPVFRGVHQDGSAAIEIPSPIFSNLSEAKAFYTNVKLVADSLGLKPHGPIMISGGGHIHAGPLPNNVTYNLIRDSQNRPYLSWVLNEWGDSGQKTFASSLQRISKELKEAAKTIKCNPVLFAYCDRLSEEGQLALLFYGNPAFVSAKWLKNIAHDVPIAYSSEYNTVEFRCFQAALDWAEQEAHLQLVDGYIRWIAKQYETEAAVPVLDTVEKVQAITKAEAASAFCNFVEMLGLNPDSFKYHLKTNLPGWFKRKRM